MTDIKKIDVHAHCVAWPEYEPCYMGTNKKKLDPPALFAEYYDKLNIERGVLLPGVSPEGALAPLPSNINKYLSDKYPDRLYWFCNVDPRQLSNTKDSNLGYLIEHYKSLGARGVGEVTCNIYTDDPMLDNLYYYCAELDMPVTIHIAPSLGGYYGIVDSSNNILIKNIRNYPPEHLIQDYQFWPEL